MENKTESQEKKGKPPKKSKGDYKWALSVFIFSFTITITLSFLSNEILSNLHIIISFLILIFFILLGVIFDIIGLAIATADEKQFHSMAARKIKSAKHAVRLIRNAEKVSSFCNDVIGDIAGIISGATGAAISVTLISLTSNDKLDILISLGITGIIAATTVGSKALGKSIAINNNNEIVNIVSKIVAVFLRDKKQKNIKTRNNQKQIK